MLQLAASLSPGTLPADRPCAATIELVLRNRGDAPLTIHVGFGSAPLLGWQGPFFSIELHHPDGSVKPPVCLRDSYYPPAPLSAEYVEQFAKTLHPGDAHTTTAPCAWYPFGTLPAESLDPRTLDPEAMDGLAERPPDPGWPPAFVAQLAALREKNMPADLAHSSILSLGPFEELEKRRRTSPGFLRPGFFFATAQAGAHALHIGYRADGFEGWTAKTVLSAKAAPLVLRLPRA